MKIIKKLLKLMFWFCFFLILSLLFCLVVVWLTEKPMYERHIEPTNETEQIYYLNPSGDMVIRKCKDYDVYQRPY